MIPLSIFEPTKTRSFNYYDRCAIELDADEMKSARVRISVTILATPLFRSLNLKYPFPKEFYGYGQAFLLQEHYADFPINYTGACIWDWQNEHGILAHQLTSIAQKLKTFCQVSSQFQRFILPLGDEVAARYDALDAVLANFTEGLTYEESLGTADGNPSNDRVNAFEHPFNLLRFRFPFGTVFNIAIDSWQPGNTLSGSLYGYPEATPPYDTGNPSQNIPTPSEGANNPANPYGAEPPDSSPYDPNLDPGDYSNAPPPDPVESGYCLRVVGQIFIRNIDSAPRDFDETYGAYEEPVTGSWDEAGFSSETPPRQLYILNVRNSFGTIIDVPITNDLLGTASITAIDCPL